MRAITALLLCPVLVAAAPMPTVETRPEGEALSQALRYYCYDWVQAMDGEEASPRPEAARAAGWMERASYVTRDPTKARPSGKMQQAGGDWGAISLIRLKLPDGGHRCTMTMMLRSDPWSTDAPHQVISDFVAEKWPGAIRAKHRAEGPRDSRETVWHAAGDIQVTVQEAKGPNATPNVFVLVTRQKLKDV
jgi:hypothetical protein